MCFSLKLGIKSTFRLKLNVSSGPVDGSAVVLTNVIFHESKFTLIKLADAESCEASVPAEPEAVPTAQ